MLFHITAVTPSPSIRKSNDEDRRATPSQVFLDFDPILPGWPVLDCGPRAHDHVGPLTVKDKHEPFEPEHIRHLRTDANGG